MVGKDEILVDLNVPAHKRNKRIRKKEKKVGGKAIYCMTYLMIAAQALRQ
jgi:hypothetical protein